MPVRVPHIQLLKNLSFYNYLINICRITFAPAGAGASPMSSASANQKIACGKACRLKNAIAKMENTVATKTRLLRRGLNVTKLN